MIDTEYLAALTNAFFQIHGCEAFHLRTEHVFVRFEANQVWSGEVEVFWLLGHPQTARGFAWIEGPSSAEEITAVVQLPPNTSPITAIRVAGKRGTLKLQPTKLRVAGLSYRTK